jgi:hypothetical protein
VGVHASGLIRKYGNWSAIQNSKLPARPTGQDNISAFKEVREAFSFLLHDLQKDDEDQSLEGVYVLNLG